MITSPDGWRWGPERRTVKSPPLSLPMPTLYAAERRRELVDRLAHLTAGRPARWGRFTAPQMVTHLLESSRMATGELQVPARPLPLQFLLRPLFIHLLPFLKNAPTAPLLLAREPATWARDVDALRAAIESVREPAAGAAMPDHPAFGTMSAHDWGVLRYKHMDHHFRQFDI